MIPIESNARYVRIRMSEYRDDVAALLARIQTLEQDLAEAKGIAPSAETKLAPTRCPHCARKMVAGKLIVHRRFGQATGVLDFRFRREGRDDEDADEVNQHQSANADWFCTDCSTVVVKGRFAD